MINNIIKNIKFLLNVFFIFITESTIYGFNRDYYSFIDRVAIRLSSINILYVKIFQAFALNNSFIDDNINNKLIKFTDNAPWNFSDIDLLQLTVVADKYDIDLKRGYEIPINSGMISLVFKGYDKNNPNKEIIIKMKRKNIQKRLDDAIDNLLFFMYVLSFIPIIHKYQLADVVNKNIDIIRRQTNFLEEINNMEKMRENCKNLKYVKIPIANKAVTEEYPDVIVMDRIMGMKINEIVEEDYDDLAKLVVKFGIVTTTVHGLVHGDLHGGNILFIKDKTDLKYPYKIGVIDFGIIYEVDNKYKALLFDVFTKLFEISPRESAIKLINSGIFEPQDVIKNLSTETYNNIIDILAEILSDTITSSKKANQLQIYKALSKINECLSKQELNNIGIRPSDQFVKGQLILAMTHGVTLTLSNGNFIRLMDDCINELFHTELLLQN
jgi:predicted unusual protein kinase regulating ubiquinone biosynthesis (AarF/ABC1/UbiB family)